MSLNIRITQDIIRLDDNKTTWLPIGDVSAPTILHHQTPICQCPSPLSNDQSPILSLLSVWFIFGCLTFFVILFVLSHHAQLLYPCFILSLRLCAPLIHSFPDSSSDVSLFISLTAPLAFVFCWFIHSHNPLLFRLLTNHSHTPYLPLFPYHFLYGQMFPQMGEQ